MKNRKHGKKTQFLQVKCWKACVHANFTMLFPYIKKNLIGTIIITIENNKKSPYYSFKYSNKNMLIRLPTLYYISITPQTQIFLPILFSIWEVPPKWVRKLRNFIKYIKFALRLTTSFQTFLTHINFHILFLYI